MRLPQDVEACHAQIAELASRLHSQGTLVDEQPHILGEMRDSPEQLSRENADLKLPVERLLALLYGRRSEPAVEDTDRRICHVTTRSLKRRKIRRTAPSIGRSRGRDLMRPTKELFRHWGRCRDGTITRTGMLRLMRPIREEIDGLLLRGMFSGNAKLIGMCTPLYNHGVRLWTFLDVESVEPTNNVSECALHPAVIWRKLSFGTQSAKGSRFVETILTIVETCRRQSRNSFEYLTAAMQAHFAGQPAPSLLAGV